MLFALACCALSANAQTLECTFTQVRTIQISAKVIRSEGKVTFTPPDEMAMTYTQPEGEYLIISGPMLRMNSMGQKLNIDTTKNPHFQNLRNTLLNCITANYEQAAIDNDAELKVTEKGGVKTVTMTARKPQPRGYSKIVMDYNQKNLPVRMILEEFGGITTDYRFTY